MIPQLVCAVLISVRVLKIPAAMRSDMEKAPLRSSFGPMVWSFSSSGIISVAIFANAAAFWASSMSWVVSGSVSFVE